MTAQRPTLADLWSDHSARDSLGGLVVAVVGFVVADTIFSAPKLILGGIALFAVWCACDAWKRYEALTVDSTPADTPYRTDTDPETDTSPAPVDPAADGWWNA
ncbi:hypothetical protein [Mycolicibacterium porcinum]|uniref:Uncharacterized protein n=1 Tax=Mycolicibacterium porcinum TaxID=39693 RepID=A0ABV3VPH3_9MYCO